MIEADVSAYVTGAYAVTLMALSALVLTIVLRAHAWAKRAKELERKP